ncbi:hypothetical protein IRT38_00255 (plasmid) [Acinetobacter sp. SK-43]|uniref:hypothetical protein n=1 Tax=Pseudomonadota TaxID=1224 RepID=UPI00188A1AFD|nr:MULTISPECIES: hypothetical protein [Pseudomonadota]MBF4453845.1 hypothetical protein [Acinetobacter sp. SK-43]
MSTKVNDSPNKLDETAENFKKTLKEGQNQYSEARKKAEETINRGASITNHKIKL